MIGRSVVGAVPSSTRGVPPLTGDRFQFDARDDSIEPARDIDLPLRAEKVEHESTSPDEPESPSSGRGIAAGMLVIGLLAGFVGGFVTGQRMAPPLPGSVADVPRSQDTPPDPEPATTTITESPVVDVSGAPAARADERVGEKTVPAREQSPVPVAAAPVAPPAITRSEPTRAEAPRVPTPAQPAMLELASRPSGAIVFLDDVRVGVTPVTINDVMPGSRRVRMELQGHQPWSTSIDVEVGAHVRIGASLE